MEIHPTYVVSGEGWLPTPPAVGQAAAGGPALVSQAHPKSCIPLDVVCWALLSLINNGVHPSSDDLTSLSVYCLTLCFPASGPCKADF